MARLSPEQYNPITSWRFKIQFSSLPEVGFYAKSITLPQIDNAPLTLEYGNTQMKIKGKTKWNDVEMVMYAYEKMTNEQLWEYMTTLHQKVDDGTDFYGEKYKLDVLIQIMSPGDQPIAKWTLIGAFANLINFGEMDYSTEEVVQPRITFSYDYALYEKQGYQFT